MLNTGNNINNNNNRLKLYSTKTSTIIWIIESRRDSLSAPPPIKLPLSPPSSACPLIFLLFTETKEQQQTLMMKIKTRTIAKEKSAHQTIWRPLLSSSLISSSYFFPIVDVYLRFRNVNEDVERTIFYSRTYQIHKFITSNDYNVEITSYQIHDKVFNISHIFHIYQQDMKIE